MGSTIEECRCPRCKYEHCYSEFYYKIGVELLSCPRCGYNVDWENMYSLNKLERIVTGGVGAYCISYDGIAQSGNFYKPSNLKAFIREYKKTGFKTKKGQKPTAVTYTFKKGRKWMLHNLTTGKTTHFTKDIEFNFEGEPIDTDGDKR